MKSSPTRHGFLVLAVLLASSAVFAVDIPLNNWAVPPYYASSARGGITTMGDITPGVAFVGVNPCRLVDTRQALFPAGYGTPALAAGVPRNFDLNSDPLCTGLPTDATIQAYSLNFTVTNVQGPGFLKVFPQGGSIPVDISTLNYIPGQNTANAAIVPAGTGGGITVISGVSGTDLIIDINGYFSVEPGNLGNAFEWDSANTGTFGAAIITNTNTSGSRTFGLVARANATGNGTAAVFGDALGTSNNIFGGKFFEESTNFDAAGVKGVNGFGDPLGDTVDCSSCFTAGVRGVGGAAYGVLGISRVRAIGGVLLASTGTSELASGYLGTSVGTDPDGGGPPWAVFGQGNIGATGIKPFLEPHPADASLIIQYIALEGPEAGTYFRGKGKFERGTAIIEVPEDFRMVTDSEGLSIQVTPIGEMATVAVASIGLDRIVVKGSRNVEFFYTVNGVRSTFKDLQPIRRGAEFAPAKADATMPAYLSEGQKRLLIQNGTYKPDGTVNMETARRVGWDKIWEAQNRPQPQPISDTP